MNKIFKVIWNHTTQTWVAVSELDKARGKTKSIKKTTALSTLAISLMTAGATVIGGQALAANIEINTSDNASATGINSMAIGGNSKASGKNSIAMGVNANVTNTRGIAIGENSSSVHQQGIAIGFAAKTSTDRGNNGIAIGTEANASHHQTIAIGWKAEASDNSAIAMGWAANASGEATVAVGPQAKAYLNDSISIGRNATSNALQSIAIGYSTQVTGQDAIGMGRDTNVTGQSAVAIGNGSKSHLQDSVALGSESETSNGTAVTSATVNNITYSGFKGALTRKTLNRVVSVGIAGNERQIQNVAAGNISADSTDAINGSQLYMVSYELSKKLSGGEESYLHVNDGSKTTLNGNQTTNKGSYGQTGGALTKGSIAVGVNAVASGSGGLAIGQNTTARGDNSIAMGLGTNANASDAVGIGNGAAANGVSSVAISKGATAASRAVAIGESSNAQARSVAIGNSATTSGSNSVAMGNQANANKESAALGFNATASNVNTTALGANSKASSVNATALGYLANAEGLDATALGSNSIAREINATAVGYSALALGIGSSALGSDTNASHYLTTAIGSHAKALAESATALGERAEATANFSTAVGSTAFAKGEESIAIGHLSNATGIASTAINNLASSSGNYSTAIGLRTEAIGENSVSIGRQGKAIGDNSISMGTYTEAVGNLTIAMGYQAKAQNDGDVAIGNSATSSGGQSTALGQSSSATGLEATALGYSSSANELGSVAVGRLSNATYSAVALGSEAKARAAFATALGAGSNASDSWALALGYKSNATLHGSVALGYQAETTEGTAVNNATVNGIIYNGFAGVLKDTHYVVSVGKQGAERQIQNVAAGRISEDSTDAINGSQLYAVITRSAWKTNVGGNKATDANTTLANINSGDTVNFNDGNGIEISRTFTTVNGTDTVEYGFATKVDNKTIKIDDAGNIAANTTALSPNTTTGKIDVPNNGDNLVNASTVANAINHSGWKIKGNGTETGLVNPGDNVNFNAGSGLNVKVEANGNDGFNVTYALANTTAEVVDGKANVTDGNAILNGTQVADLVNNASFNVTTAKNNKDIDESKNDGESAIKAGDSITYIAGNNLEVKKEGTNITYALSKNVNITENLTVNGDTTVGNLTVNPNSNINMGNNVIHNVSAGVADNDAVNVSQLKDTVNAAKTEVKEGDGISVVKTSNGTADVYTVSVNNTTGKVTAKGNVSVADQNSYLKAGEVEKLVNGAFWKVGDNDGTVKHNVTAGNQVDFINGQGTTSVVTQEADGKNKVSFDVNVDGKTTDYTEAPVYQKDANGNIVKAPDGKPVQEKNADGTPKTIKQVSVLTGDITPVRDLSDPNAGKVKFDATNGSIATVEQVADAINGSGWKTTDKDGKTVLVNPGATVNYVNGKNTKANVTKNASGGVDVTYDVDVTVPTTSTSVEASGKAQLDNPAEGNAFVNATTMRDTINNVSHTITSVNKPTEQVVANNGVTTKVKAGNTVTYAAGKNLVVRQDGSTMTYGLARDIDINSVQFNGGPTITNTADGDLKVAKADGSAARITNVAAGKAPTDAVNVSQLDDKIGNLNNKINKNNKGNRAGIASVAAMANIPQVYLPGKSGLGVGVGTREGQAALAVGYSRSSDNGKHIIKLSVGVDSQSKSTAAAGYMYQW